MSINQVSLKLNEEQNEALFAMLEAANEETKHPVSLSDVVRACIMYCSRQSIETVLEEL